MFILEKNLVSEKIESLDKDFVEMANVIIKSNNSDNSKFELLKQLCLEFEQRKKTLICQFL